MYIIILYFDRLGEIKNIRISFILRDKIYNNKLLYYAFKL